MLSFIANILSCKLLTLQNKYMETGILANNKTNTIMVMI
jgi:hypothetical protein